MVVNDGDVGIWCSPGNNGFVSISLVIFLGSPPRGVSRNRKSDGNGNDDARKQRSDWLNDEK